MTVWTHPLGSYLPDPSAQPFAIRHVHWNVSDFVVPVSAKSARVGYACILVQARMHA